MFYLIYTITFINIKIEIRATVTWVYLCLKFCDGWCCLLWHFSPHLKLPLVSDLAMNAVLCCLPSVCSVSICDIVDII